jgi:hypothetical protein
MIDGSSSNDKPLAFHWHAIDEGWIDVLGLSPAPSKAYAQARASIVLEALITERSEPGRWISYSRSKGWYAHGQRYRGTCYTFSTVPRAVDELERLGLIEHDRAPVGRLGWQSRFRATPALIRAVAIPVVVYDPGETIRLKDEHDNLRDYRETDAIIRMRRKVARINEALRAEQIGIRGVEEPVAIIDGRPLNLGQDQLHRVFNRGSFSLGGRMYGPFWQNLPKRVRPDLIINGELTDEADYSQLHPRLLYAKASAVLTGDAYELDGWDRPLVKRAFNIAINADTEVAAIRAIARMAAKMHMKRRERCWRRSRQGTARSVPASALAPGSASSVAMPISQSASLFGYSVGTSWRSRSTTRSWSRRDTPRCATRSCRTSCRSSWQSSPPPRKALFQQCLVRNRYDIMVIALRFRRLFSSL